ncbi:MAG: hypothetical protein JW772_01270 [Candidatus Diapherotrites archaeon]|nr:hypothetical protein [Candidatus Diapherotrites archaeon]
MIGGRTLSWSWRISIFLAALAIVVYALFGLRVWSDDWTTYFLRTQNWVMLIAISIAVMAVSKVFIWLLQWQFRAETRPDPKRRRRNR